MGTDIHLIAEVQTGEDEYGEKIWEFIPGPIVDCWACDGTGVAHEWDKSRPPVRRPTGSPCQWCGPHEKYPRWKNEPDMPPGKHRDGWYTDRNYTVFGILADVRNGRGFAGSDLGDPVEPIAPDRGLPDDMSDEAYLWFRHHGGDHSDTWVMLSELLEHDWDQPMVHRGVVNVEEFDVYLREGKPKNWSGDVWGGSVHKISNDAMREMVVNRQRTKGALPSGNVMAEDPLYVTQIQWVVPQREFCENFLERVKMLAIEAGERPCRLSFNFDS